MRRVVALLAVFATVLTGMAVASASPGPTLIGPNDPRFTFMGHWGHTADAAITVNSGSELRFRFTGRTLHGLFDTSTITVPSQIYVSIDGATPTLDKVDRDEIDFSPTPLAYGSHTVQLEVKDVDEYENRWILPLQSGVVLKGFRLDPLAQVLPSAPLGQPRMEFYGDSITEGVMARCPVVGVDCADGTVDYAHLTGEAFKANFNQVGFGKQGIIQPGHGNVGTAAQSFGSNFAGSPADPHFDPDAVVVNEGTNDSAYTSDQFRPGYLAYLREIRAADPRAWIFAMRPFGGYHADDIAWAVNQLHDPKVSYIDTTGWLSVAAGDFNGSTHPNVQGHQKAAAHLIAVIESVTGWRADHTPRLGPVDRQHAVCVDTPLQLQFDQPPQLGTSGTIQVHRADGTVADSIDLADPASYQRTIGDAVSDTGVQHEFAYHPVIVTGETATIYLHHELDYGQTYYVTADPGVFTGFAGINDATTWRFTTKITPPRPGADRLTVNAVGGGDFCTVQGAIDAVPEGNTKPVGIDVGPGTYTEIDYVRPDRPHITVQGAGADRTVIQYANNDVLNGDTHLSNAPNDANVCPRRVLPTPDLHNCWRALFGEDAADFTLKDLTLHNTTPYGGSQAEAFRGNNDRIVLDHVKLDSFQDTLRLQGNGYVTDSYIEGDVDFIWGTGEVFIQNSEIKALHPGYYTQIRNDATTHGAVFVHDRLTRAAGVPDDSVYLSRIETNRFPYSQAVFIDTAMDAHVKPVGWQITPNDCSQAPDLQFAEYRSTDLTGHPLNVSQRLACSRQLDAAEAARWSDPTFVLGGWTPVGAQQPEGR